jgi:hypothetical protein
MKKIPYFPRFHLEHQKERKKPPQSVERPPMLPYETKGYKLRPLGFGDLELCSEVGKGPPLRHSTPLKYFFLFSRPLGLSGEEEEDYDNNVDNLIPGKVKITG